MTIEDVDLDPEIRAAMCDGLIKRVATSLGLSFNPERRPDIYDQCRDTLVVAAKSWDPAKGKFITHAWTALSRVLPIQGERRKKEYVVYNRAEEGWERLRAERAADEPAAKESRSAAAEAVAVGMAALSDEERARVEQWVDCGYNASELARRVGGSKWGAVKKVRRALDKMRRAMGRGDDV